MNFQTENQSSETAEIVDLTDILEDTTSSLHSLSRADIQLATLCGNIAVFDLKNVFATSSAASAIKRAYLTVPHIVERYARNYTAKLFRELSRGNYKGLSILDPHASTYEHLLASGQVIVVRGETVEVKGQYNRRLMISLKSTSSAGGAA